MQTSPGTSRAFLAQGWHIAVLTKAVVDGGELQGRGGAACLGPPFQSRDLSGCREEGRRGAQGRAPCRASSTLVSLPAKHAPMQGRLSRVPGRATAGEERVGVQGFRMGLHLPCWWKRGAARSTERALGLGPLQVMVPGGPCPDDNRFPRPGPAGWDPLSRAGPLGPPHRGPPGTIHPDTGGEVKL